MGFDFLEDVAKEKNLFISIITPTYNRSDELEYLFKSLIKQSVSHKSFELIISDDGSTDSTEEIVKYWKSVAKFNTKFLTQENQGPGAARNHGLENSKGDLILFIDSDCEAHPNWIYEIVQQFVTYGFDACGGPDGSKEDFTKLQKAIDFSMTSFLTTGGIRGHSEKMLSNFYPRTHNMGITRKKYNEIGGFGNLRHGQDIEFSNRIKKSGGNIKFIKDALVYHRRRSSLKQFVKQVFNWGVARVNLAKIDLSMLEPVHFLPSICCILFCFLIVIAKYFGWENRDVFLMFFLPLSVLSLFGSINKNDLSIFPFLLLVIPSQIFGYGLGFLQAFVRRFIFNAKTLVGFKKNYYK
tara:strand:+ start:1852 stop:2910 length:1059 start_codon:yes stop_codon:yes gene_type:complete